ncbi:MAG: hypothetical protein D6812_05710 [Deltaproteobacteria bacterium]|nr:MAG: hypothetical protein D6812_05710 [Deltaproteobacteria bacterium]
MGKRSILPPGNPAAPPFPTGTSSWESAASCRRGTRPLPPFPHGNIELGKRSILPPGNPAAPPFPHGNIELGK